MTSFRRGRRHLVRYGLLALRFCASVFILLSCILLAGSAEAAGLERGAAIIDPLALRELDIGEASPRKAGRSGFGLRLFVGSRPTDAPILNSELFVLSSMVPVRRAIDDEFNRYIAGHKGRLPNETIGIGDGFDWQLFDRTLLDSAGSRFVLAGIVNRMDRTFVSPETCGEIRLIYRLTRLGEPPAGENAGSQRLPMTLNVVLKAKGEKVPRGVALTCKEIARRWLATATWTQTGAELASRLVSAGGPLESIEPADVDRIETNLQIAHAPKSAVRDFRTDYLLKVFRFNTQTRLFEEAPMENQIDRDRLLADPALARDFKAWLLDVRHLNEFDRGTILIPERFLARGAIAATPAGFDRSELQPMFGLLQGEGAASPVFGESDIVTALRKAAEAGVVPRNIRSLAGFERRLNDVTCAGCHQVRGIGGFHFPGVDWMAAKPSNDTVVPASPHFFGDQLRRRDILSSLSSDSRQDYSRAFSERPQMRARPEFARELSGTGYLDGWGARCYQQVARDADNDPSFRDWTCAKGLDCQKVGKTSRIGMCFVSER